MNQIKLIDINESSKAFIIDHNGEKVAEMVITIKNDVMSVHHTEVNRELEGKGVAKELLNEMAGHARANNLKVLPLCTYVCAQFRRNPEQYADIWKKGV